VRRDVNRCIVNKDYGSSELVDGNVVQRISDIVKASQTLDGLNPAGK
jgi:cob(I)alamin adenosyltransferase